MAGVPSALKQQLAAIELTEKASPAAPAGVVVSPVQSGEVRSPGQPSFSVVETKSVDVPPATVTPSARIESPTDKVPAQIDSEITPKAEDWKQKFLSLKGKYDSEITAVTARLDLIEKNREFIDGKVDAKSKELADAKAEIARLQEALDAANPVDMLDGLSAEDREAYADSLPVIKSVAERIAKQQVSKIDQKLQQIDAADKERQEKFVAEKAAQAKHSSQQFFEKTAQKVSGSVDAFQDLITSLDFVEFRNTPVAGTGRAVNDYLLEAHERQDETRIDHWFKKFEEFKTRSTQSTSLPVVPKKTSGGETPTEGKIYTMDDLRTLHKQLTSKAISQEEFAKRKAIIDQAEKEGRFKE